MAMLIAMVLVMVMVMTMMIIMIIIMMIMISRACNHYLVSAFGWLATAFQNAEEWRFLYGNFLVRFEDTDFMYYAN